ncbi:endonuclease/exonuclease/phosphatase family protein [Tunicatimonas pelagia]|uniref:endonuclease/exonuclease/phosphatase family protein n=1 Tax=Tunicatimonas pelagia TaxID=931531 RepID=UPI002665BC85|nr:endonuclease/exonuclease/phosphatase family protein [Tunicatimonas pelagia]WKN44807.1 hypothetical protein P0M28_07490 [Tunicatimonas pelagia]
MARFLKNIIPVLVLLSALIFVIPTRTYLVDTIQSFALQTMLVYGFVAIVLMVGRQKKLAASFFMAFSVILAYVVSSLNTSNTQDYQFEEHAFRVANFNVLESDTQYDEIAGEAHSTQADLLSFQEIDSLLMAELTVRLEEKYPYYHEAYSTEQEVTGVAVFSKYPVEGFTAYYWGGQPNLTGNVLLPDTSVHFVATHTLSPYSPNRYTKRNQHLQQLARYLEDIEGAVLAIGGFNAIP